MNKPKHERKAKAKKETAALQFVLPSSLPEYSKISLPILIERRPTTKWKDIIQENEIQQQEIEEHRQSKSESVSKPPFMNTEMDYIQRELFKYLIPALEETLEKAKIWQVFKTQKCFFNGVDHVAQVLWNNNPRYPYRQFLNTHIFNMKWVREYLRSNPRPYYPKSWLWPEDYAATVIQKTVRQYFVQRNEEVQEMRDFWRKLEMEKEEEYDDIIGANPLLARKFASMPSIKIKSTVSRKEFEREESQKK